MCTTTILRLYCDYTTTILWQVILRVYSEGMDGEDGTIIDDSIR